MPRRGRWDCSPPSRRITDEEALQLILEPGFSTADRLTQQAGRGVGMDVVATEVKKLGGGLFIESISGRGARFTIRLPFTLAITQALIVRVHEELFALPVATVEGVARLPRIEILRHIDEEAASFEYGGQSYRFQYLGAFVGSGPSPLPESDAAVPVILVRAGEHSTALVTDELLGSREIVVKSLGPQIAAIRGISGATILGDGRIVVILDVGALVRSEWRSRPVDAARAPARDDRIFALVVDDSITVRRVTQRLLERNGMRVMTAKDGVDAMSLLQDHIPDVILLDIEMPRMDGYEVAAHVRSDPRLTDVPIIMITSRVGDKHRARAIELGVDDYLGKPYQESQLLDAIEPLVLARRQQIEAGHDDGDAQRRTLLPARAAARGAAAAAARLRERGHQLPGADANGGRAAVVPRLDRLGRPARAARVVRGGVRTDAAARRRPHAHRRDAGDHRPSGRGSFRRADAGFPAARARERRGRACRTIRACSASAAR